MMNNRQAHGFALLEGLVALVILGMTLMPVAVFISQSALQLRVIADSNARNLAQQNILAFLETLNPLPNPIGTIELGDITVSWTSEPIVLPNPTIRVATGLAAYSIGLYRVSAKVYRHDSRNVWFEFQVRKVGYQRLQVAGPGAGP